MMRFFFIFSSSQARYSLHQIFFVSNPQKAQDLKRSQKLKNQKIPAIREPDVHFQIVQTLFIQSIQFSQFFRNSKLRKISRFLLKKISRIYICMICPGDACTLLMCVRRRRCAGKSTLCPNTQMIISFFFVCQICPSTGYSVVEHIMAAHCQHKSPKGGILHLLKQPNESSA